jgi:ABC-type oligopeptide transport system substrate-binding subunit
VAAVLIAFMLVAAACGSDDSDSGSGNGVEGGETSENGVAGGEFVDLGTFLGDPPEHIDPALNVTLDAYQVINALYDGLTEIDSTDPDNPEVVPLVADSFESNDDATVWTFHIRDGQEFSNGEAIVPSSFVRGWERASDPDFAGDYSYLMNFIQGGAEKLAGDADTLEGVVADDDAMTLEVTLSAPYANFPAVAGFQLFFPMPSAVDDLDDQNDWENGLMIGNGPYMLESPRTDQEIVLVKNDNWKGDFNQETWDDRLDKITFVVSADVDSAYNSFEAGEGNDANIPPGRAQEADDNYATTLDVNILGSYYYQFNMSDPTVGGPENVLLRQAISQAIDREDINTAVYDGTRTIPTGVTPRGIPGFAEGLCDYCSYDPDAAQEAFDQWKAEGNELTDPILIDFNPDNGHEPVVQIIVDNLNAIGIDAQANPGDVETYFSDLSDGACHFCRAGWYADYPTYDNFMFDLFTQGSSNNYGYANDEFDDLVAEAKSTVDPDDQAALFQQAEDILLNEDIGVVPINWYLGDYVYNPETVARFPQTNLGLIQWEQVQLVG